MRTFKVEITETLQRIVEVEAESLSEAIIKVGTDYDNGKIVLDAMDFDGFDIRGIKEE